MSPLLALAVLCVSLATVVLARRLASPRPRPAEHAAHAALPAAFAIAAFFAAESYGAAPHVQALATLVCALAGALSVVDGRCGWAPHSLVVPLVACAAPLAVALRSPADGVTLIGTSAAGVLAFLAADRAFMRGAFRTPPGDVAMLALIPSLLWNAPAALAAAGVTLALLAVRRLRPGYAIDLMSPEDKADAVSDLEELGGAPRTDWAPMGPLCGLIVLASVLSGFSFS